MDQFECEILGSVALPDGRKSLLHGRNIGLGLKVIGQCLSNLFRLYRFGSAEENGFGMTKNKFQGIRFYFPSLASMVCWVWGTARSRSLGMSLPDWIQMP